MNPPASQSLPARVATGLAKIGLALRHKAEREGNARGLSPLQGQVLAVLAARPGVTLGELGAIVGVRPSTLSECVSSIVGRGLVVRRRRSDDARALELALTARGGREAVRASEWTDFLAAAVHSLPADEQAVMLRALTRMIASLEAQGQIPASRMCATCVHFRPGAHAGSDRPHHCAFIDAPIAAADLRLDCPDHDPAPPEHRERSLRLAVLVPPRAS